MKVIFIPLLFLCVTGCSAFVLGENGRPYHGTAHAISALYCTPYNSIYDKSTGEPWEVGVEEKVFGILIGVPLNSLDFLTSALTDTILLPRKLLEDQEPKNGSSHLKPNKDHPTVTQCRDNLTMGNALGSI